MICNQNQEGEIMSQHRLHATFMRGGTSKALVLHRADLPANQADWAPIFFPTSTVRFGNSLKSLGKSEF
jgi:hypothetical protein